VASHQAPPKIRKIPTKDAAVFTSMNVEEGLRKVWPKMSWMNVVAACRHCNGHKRNRLPEESGLELMYAPYVPNKAEYLILTNRRIFADQMEFLRQHVAAHSRLVQAPA